MAAHCVGSMQFVETTDEEEFPTYAACKYCGRQLKVRFDPWGWGTLVFPVHKTETSLALGRKTTTRDAQKNRLYRAENKIDWGRTFETISEIQEYVNRLVRSEWWKRRFAVREVHCHFFERGRARSFARGTHVHLVRRHFWELIILHEVAHTVSPRGHGNEYARNYLELVRHQMGKEAGAQLERQFKAAKVKYHRSRKKRGKIRDPETLEAMRERAAKARAARKGATT